jgi:transcriptional regulator with XRE-family HTH domain
MIANRAEIPGKERPPSNSRGYGIAADGRALRRARRIRGVTGAELAKCAGVSAATVSQAENGHRVHPRMLKAIAVALASIEPVPGLADIAAEDGDV